MDAASPITWACESREEIETRTPPAMLPCDDLRLGELKAMTPAADGAAPTVTGKPEACSLGTEDRFALASSRCAAEGPTP